MTIDPEIKLEIKTNFLERRAEIDALDQELAQERRNITDKAFSERRPLNAEELARRKQIGATRMELAEALSILALSTLADINCSKSVSVLNARIKDINEALSDDLDHLKSLEDYAAAAAKVASGLVKVSQKVASIIVR